MKTLYLARHAKAEKGFDNIIDFDRPLNNRGVKDASLMGAMLKQRNIVPSVFITSPAIRALSTAFIFAREMQFPWDRIKIAEPIYEASTYDLLEIMQGVNDAYDSVMLFGHNPAFTEASNTLTAGSIENVATSGVVSIDFEVQSWKEIGPGKGKLVSFITPKGLM